MVDQNLVLSNKNGASNWVEDHTNVKPLQNHVKIHHFILGNKLNLMITKLWLQWNIIPSLKSVYSKPRKPQNELYSTQGCSWMVLRHSTELASKYMVDIKGFDLNPLHHNGLVWNSSTPNMRGKFDVAWKLSPKFYDICEVQFPAAPCASSILATLPRLYRPLCKVNWFSENPLTDHTWPWDSRGSLVYGVARARRCWLGVLSLLWGGRRETFTEMPVKQEFGSRDLDGTGETYCLFDRQEM